MLIFFLIIAASALFAAVTALAMALIIKKSLSSGRLVGRLPEESLFRAFDDPSLTGAIEGLLDDRLDSLVVVFKQQIPMASTFLAGPLLVRLKSQAKEEFMAMVPELKERLVKKIASEKCGRLLAQEISASLPVATVVSLAAACGAAIGLAVVGAIVLLQLL